LNEGLGFTAVGAHALSQSTVLRLPFTMAVSEQYSLVPPAVPSSPPPVGRLFTNVGLALLPLAAVLLVLELVGGARGVVHYLSMSGITAKRRRWETAFCLVGGLVGPLAATLIAFDLLRTGTTWKSRLALIGFVASPLAAMAVLLLFPLSV
jgi:hypothetical protein